MHVSRETIFDFVPQIEKYFAKTYILSCKFDI